MPRTKTLPVPANGTVITALPTETLQIRPYQSMTAVFRLRGLTPYMQCRFSEKNIKKIQETHKQGQQSRSRRTREARDFDDDYRNAMHLLEDGSHGIPCTAIRNACISTCRLCGFKMTIAKLSIFVIADGLDVVDGTPLFRIEGQPEQSVLPVRNATGVIDLRVRPLWREWAANVTLRWDMDQLSSQDIINLLVRAGQQVGIGEGRPDSRDSNGIGYGLFEVET